MTIDEKIYVSLETAEKLKAAGWTESCVYLGCIDKRYNSLGMYHLQKDGCYFSNDESFYGYIDLKEGLIPIEYLEYLFFPTFQEIWEDMPTSINIDGTEWGLAQWKYRRGIDGATMASLSYSAIAEDDNCLTHYIRVLKDTSVEAAAELWLKLKEERLI